SPDARRMAVADTDGTVRVLDPDSGRTRLTKIGDDPVSYYLEFTRDSQALVGLGKLETPWIWTLADGKRVYLYKTQEPNGRTYGLTPNGQWHESSDRGEEILLRLWSLPDGRIVRERMLPNFGWDQIDFSPDDRLVALTHFGCDPKPPRL